MKLITTLLCWLLLSPAFASPGAHGPNGEHLDAPQAAGQAAGAPRVETSTELFELAGQLSDGKLAILVDRYDTNEPVLNGRLEVQYKKWKAQAPYRAASGDYVLDDAAMLQALSRPGRHALLFTFTAGEDSDLIDGTLDVPQASGPGLGHAAGGAGSHWRRWAGIAAALILVAMAAVAGPVLAARRRAAAVHGPAPARPQE